MKTSTTDQRHWGQLHQTFYSRFTPQIDTSTLSLYAKTRASYTNVYLETHLTSKDSSSSPFHTVECVMPFLNPNFELLTRFRPGEAKVQLQAKETSGGKQFVFYGAVHIPKLWEAAKFQVGLTAHQSNLSKVAVRVLYRLGDQSITLMQKSLQQSDSSYIGMYSCYDLNQLVCKELALQHGWKTESGKTRFGFMLSSKGTVNLGYNYSALLDSTSFNIIHKVNESHTIGAQVHLPILKQKLAGGSIGWHYKGDDEHGSQLKIKADNNRNVSLGASSRITDYGRYGLGLNIADFGGDNRCSYGFRVDLEL